MTATPGFPGATTAGSDDSEREYRSWQVWGERRRRGLLATRLEDLTVGELLDVLEQLDHVRWMEEGGLL
jgi:hypothetical protein